MTLEALVDRMRWRASRGEPFPAEDAEFHRRLVAGSGNLVALALIDLYFGVIEVLYQHGFPGPAVTDLPAVAEGHAEIVAALRRGDGHAASHALRTAHNDESRRVSPRGGMPTPLAGREWPPSGTGGGTGRAPLARNALSPDYSSRGIGGKQLPEMLTGVARSPGATAPDPANSRTRPPISTTHNCTLSKVIARQRVPDLRQPPRPHFLQECATGVPPAPPSPPDHWTGRPATAGMFSSLPLPAIGHLPAAPIEARHRSDGQTCPARRAQFRPQHPAQARQFGRIGIEAHPAPRLPQGRGPALPGTDSARSR